MLILCHNVGELGKNGKQREARKLVYVMYYVPTTHHSVPCCSIPNKATKILPCHMQQTKKKACCLGGAKKRKKN